MNAERTTKSLMKLFAMVFTVIIYIHLQACVWYIIVSQDMEWIPPLDYIDADDMQKCSKGLTLKEKLMLSNWQSCESEERYTSINKLETIINN